MAYFFYTVTFLLLVVATGKQAHPNPIHLNPPANTCLTALYATRASWKPYAPPIPYLTAPGTIPAPLHDLTTYLTNRYYTFRGIYVRLPTSSTFAEDAESGLNSRNFDLAENIEAGDERRGLDEAGKQEVYRVMKVRRVNFDEARRIVVEERFGREGIGRDGRPLDRKAVMFS